MSTLTLQQAQGGVGDALAEIHRILSANRIPYWLDGGT